MIDFMIWYGFWRHNNKLIVIGWWIWGLILFGSTFAWLGSNWLLIGLQSFSFPIQKRWCRRNLGDSPPQGTLGGYFGGEKLSELAIKRDARRTPGFIQVRAATCVISYVMRLCGLYSSLYKVVPDRGDLSWVEMWSLMRCNDLIRDVL